MRIQFAFLFLIDNRSKLGLLIVCIYFYLLFLWSSITLLFCDSAMNNTFFLPFLYLLFILINPLPYWTDPQLTVDETLRNLISLIQYITNGFILYLSRLKILIIKRIFNASMKYEMFILTKY